MSITLNGLRTNFNVIDLLLVEIQHKYLLILCFFSQFHVLLVDKNLYLFRHIFTYQGLNRFIYINLQASEVQATTTGECSYPSSPALALGLAAAVALMIAQAMISTIAGCICCKRNTRPSDTNWSMALISFIVSW